jgi:hypothetical protein
MTNKKSQLLDATPNVGFLSTLRNSGYDNYSAISDIVDNSLDTEVNSKNVSITVKFSQKQNDSITIVDDGCGMDYETIAEAIKLGADTGKSRKTDLGSYGTGLKSAALSMGRKFTIITKAEDSPMIILEHDLDEMVEKNSFYVPIREAIGEEINLFSQHLKNTGTIIIIEKLDRISNSNVTIFKDTLSKHLGKTFKVFIEEKNIKLSINDESVKPIDPMMRNESFVRRLSSSPYESYLYGEKEIKFNVFYINKLDSKKSKEIGRNQTGAGLYIYRNNRLVGQGLDLGVVGKQGDGHLNGLRIELFVDGECDNFFSSTFTKMVSEKEKNQVNQGFRDASIKALSQYIGTARNLDSSDGRQQLVEPETMDALNDAFKNINSNKLIEVKKVGQNEKKEDTTDKKEVKNPGRNKFSPRKREDSFADYRLQSLGEFGNIFRPFYEKGKYIIEINRDHPFWTSYLSKQTPETISVVCKLFVSMSLALGTSQYYSDTEKEAFFNEYFAEWSSQTRKLILY